MKCGRILQDFRTCHRSEERKGRPDRFELLLAHGGKLDDGELLTVLLLRCMSASKAQALSTRLLAQFGSLSGVLAASPGDLATCHGIGNQAIAEILSLKLLSDAIAVARLKRGNLLQHHRDVMRFCRHLLGGKRQEEFHALFLTGKLELIEHCCLQRGTVNHVAVYPREVLRHAVRTGAAAVILVHNHPQGEPWPSTSDLEMTRRLAQLCNAVGISVRDHIIVGSSTTYSMLRNGKLPPA